MIQVKDAEEKREHEKDLLNLALDDFKQQKEAVEQSRKEERSLKNNEIETEKNCNDYKTNTC